MASLTQYRRFEVTTGPDTFLITEVEPTTRHPMNWIDGKATVEGAWERARSQHLPIFVETLEGGMAELGTGFDPKAFERAVYSGYVGYGYSMTDGHYAPLDFEAWVYHFRQAVRGALARILGNGDDTAALVRDDVFLHNDTPNYVKAALAEYTKRLAHSDYAKQHASA